jgi:hypothetical protein
MELTIRVMGAEKIPQDLNGADPACDLPRMFNNTG